MHSREKEGRGQQPQYVDPVVRRLYTNGQPDAQPSTQIATVTGAPDWMGAGKTAQCDGHWAVRRGQENSPSHAGLHCNTPMAHRTHAGPFESACRASHPRAPSPGS